MANILIDHFLPISLVISLRKHFLCKEIGAKNIYNLFNITYSNKIFQELNLCLSHFHCFCLFLYIVLPYEIILWGNISQSLPGKHEGVFVIAKESSCESNLQAYHFKLWLQQFVNSFRCYLCTFSCYTQTHIFRYLLLSVTISRYFTWSSGEKGRFCPSWQLYHLKDLPFLSFLHIQKPPGLLFCAN